MSTRGLVQKAIKAYHREGLTYLLKEGFDLFLYLVKNAVILEYYNLFRSNNTFEFDGNKYNYFCSIYGTTWRSERAVEIPIVWKFVKSCRKDQKILEVGNVLSYRFNVSHDILDKYEEFDNVINEDVVNYNPQYKYDLIVSISTLEHIGYDDEELKEPMKILTSLLNLKRILSSNGKLVVTLQLGQNQEMDSLITKKILVFDKMFYMKREKGNKWKQV